jgi:hypothetical protein
MVLFWLLHKNIESCQCEEYLAMTTGSIVLAMTPASSHVLPRGVRQGMKSSLTMRFNYLNEQYGL